MNYHTPTTDVVHVTPAQAAEWLAKTNTHNRAIREAKVAAYARDMASGAWQFNGDAIRFSVGDTLLDGQHRLSAIVRADVTLPFIVVWGLPVEAQDTIDIGARRALRDQLLLHGENNSSELAAIARRALLADKGLIGNMISPTHAELLDYIEANPGLRRAADVAMRCKTKVPAAPSAIGAAYFVCARLDASDAEIFYISQVIDGLGLFETDPAYALRQRLSKELAGRGRKMNPEDVYRFAIVAWNHFRAGRKVAKLQSPPGGWSTAPVPQPK